MELIYKNTYTGGSEFLPFIKREQIPDKIDKKDVKNLTKALCRAYKEESIPEELFHNLIAYLLAYFIENSFDDKVFSKDNELDEKLYRFHSTAKWPK